MKEEGNRHASVKAQEENNSILFLSKAARPVLSDEEISVEGLKVLYRKLLKGVGNMVEVARLESLGKA